MSPTFRRNRDRATSGRPDGPVDLLADPSVSSLLGYMLLNPTSLKSISDLADIMDISSDDIRTAVSRVRRYGFAVDFEEQGGLVEWNDPFTEGKARKLSASALEEIKKRIQKSVKSLRARSSKDEILDFLSSPLDLPRQGTGEE